MPGLYDRVQRSPRQKTFPWWAVILAIALVVLTCIGLFISRPQRIKNRYEACMDAVSASTIYAKRHRGVRALVDGQELRLRESNARSIYSSLAALGRGPLHRPAAGGGAGCHPLLQRHLGDAPVALSAEAQQLRPLGGCVHLLRDAGGEHLLLLYGSNGLAEYLMAIVT